MPFVVILARGLQVSRLGCHGAAWSLTPNFDRIASQSLVFDNFLRENTQPEIWGIQLAQRQNAWCWSGDSPTFASQCKKLHLVEPPAEKISCFQNWLKIIWRRVAEIQAGLLVIELNDAVPPWKPEQEDLDAYFPNQSAEATNEDDAWFDSEQKVATEGTGTTPHENDPKPWFEPLPREMPVNKEHPPIRRNLLLTHAAAIASLDKKLGIILDFLAEHQTPETHILLTSDLGIALGEKGFHGHGGSEPWLDTVNVPLIWCHPTRESNSLRHHALVSDKDLTELLLGDPKSPHGLLEKCWDGPREPGNPSVVTSGTGKAVACRTNEWSLVVDSSGSARLFEFPMDRWEVNDLATHHPDKLQFLLSQTTNRAICGFLRDQPGGQPS